MQRTPLRPVLLSLNVDVQMAGAVKTLSPPSSAARCLRAASIMPHNALPPINYHQQPRLQSLRRRFNDFCHSLGFTCAELDVSSASRSRSGESVEKQGPGL